MSSGTMGKYVPALPTEILIMILEFALHNDDGLTYGYPSNNATSTQSTNRLALLRTNTIFAELTKGIPFQVNRIVFEVSSEEDVNRIFNPNPVSDGFPHDNWPTPFEIFGKSPTVGFRTFSREFAERAAESPGERPQDTSLSNTIKELSERIESKASKTPTTITIAIRLYDQEAKITMDTEFQNYALRSLDRAAERGAFNPTFIPRLNCFSRGRFPESWSNLLTGNPPGWHTSAYMVQEKVREIRKDYCELEEPEYKCECMRPCTLPIGKWR